ncbi:hypothetical protein JVT61DRAFT_1014 [Boletus reticuloceps]|uniref:Uncharacterized protein n=1 Tax=Boletus reticuloceps TaxID=495285 RepID=A0A8I2YPT0_9AGAM|nr:hypothetical protein JVT61DRAFT_1014 [Boletus reticuloceps]
MGGRAFLQHLPPDSLPRLPTPLYVTLKDRLTALLLTLFAIVKVPPEKPEKEDHGDIDFVVARPLSREGITPEQVGCVLGAVKSIELEGNRTSNYAVSISQEDWLMHAAQLVPSDQIYCQVDVRVCDDEEEAQRVTVFHGYGDLGIIIGAITKSHGLSVNHHGLKVATPHPNPPMLLTSSPRVIFDFMGLSMDRWMRGFETVEETFNFAATSRFFDPRRLYVPSMHALNKSAQGRNMYSDFLVWAQDKAPTMVTSGPHQDAVEEALAAFDKKLEWDAMTQEACVRSWLRNNFSGKLVAEWTGLGWKGVKAVMDDVRASAGGERALFGMELEQVKNLVLISQKSLKLDAQ